jgi:hypothetical protein
MKATHLPLLGALVAALAAAGCAPDDPYQQDRAQRSSAPPENLSEGRHAPLPRPPADGELPGRVPAELVDVPTRFPEAGQTPQATLALAARLYGNWSSTTARSQLRRIAALSVGQAHAELRQAAAQAGADPQQRRARSRASVEAVDVDGSGPRRTALIVTRERLRAPDLPDQGWRYQVTTAQVERRGARWVISQWLAQP